MDMNMINPVINAFNQIMPQLGFSHIEEKDTAVLVDKHLDNRGIFINVSVVGPLKGSILIGMDLTSAKHIASKMMMGMPVSELDDMAVSALSELGNMVCATSCTLYSNEGIVGLDISPPNIIAGEKGQVMLSVPKAMKATFVVDDIDMDIYVGLVSQ
ncbi:chemotaxis protein CheX [Heliorestis convoluta]|uniref:Chemotaxis protein CheX n=1 Tax=Heliorestis convoluta TaxID=356322 RepID=A0A5Q2MYQ4_9FIRM|nr:chemotaxis protein CheX [Heliorestis convoluta]QGG46519.1 chemotaxis protein CheX [Heliorestis convoluta]